LQMLLRCACVTASFANINNRCVCIQSLSWLSCVCRAAQL
jgi:hypothetical protein